MSGGSPSCDGGYRGDENYRGPTEHGYRPGDAGKFPGKMPVPRSGLPELPVRETCSLNNGEITVVVRGPIDVVEAKEPYKE